MTKRIVEKLSFLFAKKCVKKHLFTVTDFEVEKVRKMSIKIDKCVTEIIDTFSVTWYNNHS